MKARKKTSLLLNDGGKERQEDYSYSRTGKFSPFSDSMFYFTRMFCDFLFAVKGNRENLITVQFTYTCVVKSTLGGQRDGGE